MPDELASKVAYARPSRRTVVRSAVWAVPAVSIVAAAPAYAATQSAGATMTVSGGTASWTTPPSKVSGNTYQFTAPFNVSGIVVKNTSTRDTATGITVTINFTGAVMTPSSKMTPSNVSSGWTYDPTSSTTTAYVFTYTGNLSPNGSTSALAVSFPLSGTASNPSGKPVETVSATAAATVNGSSGNLTYVPASQSISSTN